MRLFPTLATTLGSLAVVAVAAFFAVVFLAGPHAGLLPPTLETVVQLCVLVLPAWAAWAVWRRGRSAAPPGTNLP